MVIPIPEALYVHFHSHMYNVIRGFSQRVTNLFFSAVVAERGSRPLVLKRNFRRPRSPQYLSIMQSPVLVLEPPRISGLSRTTRALSTMTLCVKPLRIDKSPHPRTRVLPSEFKQRSVEKTFDQRPSWYLRKGSICRMCLHWGSLGPTPTDI